jgi:arylsulfatase A-like enzyme
MTFVAGLVLFCLALIACSAASEWNTNLLSHDPHSLILDYGAPTIRFDEHQGSVILGEGWAPPEFDEGFFAWASDRQAELRFVKPPHEDVDLFVRARCLSFNGAEPQIVTVALNDQDAGKIVIGADWRDHRIPLPAGAMIAGLNRLKLHFSYARRPIDVDRGRDQRRLAAAFRMIAIVPSAIAQPEALVTGVKVEPESGAIQLPAGAAIAIPVGPGLSVDLGISTASVASGQRVRISRRYAQGAVDELQTISDTSDLPASVSSQPSSTEFSVIVIENVCDVAEFGSELSSLVLHATANRSDSIRPDERSTFVFVYVIDTLRADAVLSSPTAHEVAPHLEALRRDAVTYLAAYSTSSWTLPAVASILTGLYPSEHGLVTSASRNTMLERKSLGPALESIGYRTAGFSQSQIIGPSFGFDKAFQAFFHTNQLGGWYLRSAQLRSDLLSWLLSTPLNRQPIFCYFHTVGPHAPYNPPGPFRGFASEHPGSLPWRLYLPMTFMKGDLRHNPMEVAHLKGLYLGEASYADDEIGRFAALLERLGIYDQSLLIVTSDHGEEFGEHRGFDHGRTLYDELVSVPLIVKYPAQMNAGEEVTTPVSLLDIPSTVFEVTGHRHLGPTTDGTPLVPNIVNRNHAATFRPRRFAEVVATDTGPRRAVAYRAAMLDPIKCIESLRATDQFGKPVPQWQIFDHGNDAGEVAPLSTDDPRASQCMDAIAEWAGRMTSNSSAPPSRPTLSDSTRENLRTLGYVE